MESENSKLKNIDSNLPMVVKDKKYAKDLNFYKLFWIFLIASVLGVIAETIWCVITEHRIESKASVLYGPFNLIYGFGAVIITIFLYKISDKNKLVLFLSGTFIGAIFEYICSIFQEMIFGTTSWNYTNWPLNINGRISIVFSMLWGVLVVIWFSYIYPIISKGIESMPNKIGRLLVKVLAIFMLFNIIMSASASVRMEKRYRNIEAVTVFEHFLDKHYPDRVMRKIYPNAVYTN